MPTQELDGPTARRILGTPPDFRDGPADNLIAHGLPAGSVTDDTMQCLLIADLLISGGGTIDPHRLAEALAAWEREMAERARSELLGPSTRRALAAVAAGEDPSQTGRTGTTNGAAMRITPVGIATPVEPLDRLLAAVVSADLVTHDTDIAHAGAAAVAAVVSAGVSGETFEQAAPRAVRAAARFGYADMFHEALTLGSLDAIVDRFGTGVARFSHGDVWEACGHAAALGGDTDTIAALAGAMVGACTGLHALPKDAVQKIREVNEIEFESWVDGLLKLRRR